MPTLDIPSTHRLLAWTPERWAIVEVPSDETPHHIQFNLMRAQRRGFVCLPHHLSKSWEWWGSGPVNQEQVLDLIRFNMSAEDAKKAGRIFKTAGRVGDTAGWVRELTPPDAAAAIAKVSKEKLLPSSLPVERYGVRPLPDYKLMAHFSTTKLAGSKKWRAFELWSPPGRKGSGFFKLCCIPGKTSQYANNWIRWSVEDQAIIDVIPEYCSLDVTEANPGLMRAVALRLSRKSR